MSDAVNAAAAPLSPQDDNQLIAERREKLRALREAQAQGGGVAFPNNFKPAHKAADLHTAHGHVEASVLETHHVSVSVAGRMMLKRVMGKASFAPALHHARRGGRRVVRCLQALGFGRHRGR